MERFDSSSFIWGDHILSQDDVLTNLALCNSFSKSNQLQMTHSQKTINKSQKFNTNFQSPQLFAIISWIFALILLFILVREYNKKFEEIKLRNIIKVNDSTRKYELNRCDRRVPLSEKECENWEKIMLTDIEPSFFIVILEVIFDCIIKTFNDLFEKLNYEAKSCILIISLSLFALIVLKNRH